MLCSAFAVGDTGNHKALHGDERSHAIPSFLHVLYCKTPCLCGILLDTMNDDTIADLKQFIAATVRQEIAGVEDRLSAKIDDLQTSVSEALATSNDAVDEDQQGLEQRVVRLEHKVFG